MLQIKVKKTLYLTTQLYTQCIHFANRGSSIGSKLLTGRVAKLPQFDPLKQHSIPSSRLFTVFATIVTLNVREPSHEQLMLRMITSLTTRQHFKKVFLLKYITTIVVLAFYTLTASE